MAQLYLTQGLFDSLFAFCNTPTHMKHFIKFIPVSSLFVGHVTKACDILRTIEDFKHKQGMVCFAMRSTLILCPVKKVAEELFGVKYLCM